jgi:hypothetical protein
VGGQRERERESACVLSAGWRRGNFWRVVRRKDAKEGFKTKWMEMTERRWEQLIKRERERETKS